MTDVRCFSIPNIKDWTLVKVSSNGKALLAVNTPLLPRFYKSKFNYFSFEYFSEEQRQKHKPPPVRDMYCENEFFSTGYITDCCDVWKKQRIFYVSQKMSDKHELKCYPTVYDCITDVHMTCAERSERYIFSCASDPSGSTAVTGTEYGVCIFHDFVFSHEMAVKGYVESIELNQSGNTVFCGIKSSGLEVIDLRESSTCPGNFHFYSSMKVSAMKLLPSEKSIILGDEDGYLNLVDLRTFRKVLCYSDHVSHGHKATISVNEDLDIVCATGSDNKTRLWELRTGKLFHEITPLPNEESYGCLLTQDDYSFSEAYAFTAVLQKDICYVVDPRPK